MGVKNKPGRPTKYSPEIMEQICERLSTGEPLAQICRNEGMPTDRAVHEWAKDPGISSAIAQARARGFDFIAHECLEIADDIEEDAQSRRVRIETRLKLLAKWDPKRYGEKVDVEHKGDVNVRVVIGGTNA